MHAHRLERGQYAVFALLQPSLGLKDALTSVSSLVGVTNTAGAKKQFVYRVKPSQRRTTPIVSIIQ